MRIYTRSGDTGTTALVYGKRVDKTDLRVEAYGTCDEANSIIGQALSFLDNVIWEEKESFLTQLHRVQTILFHVGAELSTPKEREVAWKLTDNHITELEEQIDEWSKALPPITQFILPSGHRAATTLHFARTVVRRAERSAVAVQDELRHALSISYLNRLSDFLFVAARYVNFCLGEKEITLQADV